MTTINCSAALLRRGRERAAVNDGWVSRRNSFSIVAEHHDAYECVREIVQGSLFSWLCAPGRTQAEVLELFDRAIAKCEEQIQKGGE
jgi:hypothetical protein